MLLSGFRGEAVSPSSLRCMGQPGGGLGLGGSWALCMGQPGGGLAAVVSFPGDMVNECDGRRISERSSEKMVWKRKCRKGDAFAFFLSSKGRGLAWNTIRLVNNSHNCFDLVRTLATAITYQSQCPCNSRETQAQRTSLWDTWKLQIYCYWYP